MEAKLHVETVKENELESKTDDLEHKEKDLKHNEKDLKHNEKDLEHNEDNLEHNEDNLKHNEDNLEHKETLKRFSTQEERLIDYLAVLSVPENGHDLSVNFPGKTAWRYPKKDHDGYSWPENVLLFLDQSDEGTSSKKRQCFALTNINGDHTFGVVVPLGSNSKSSLLICALSHYPIFTFAYDILEALKPLLVHFNFTRKLLDDIVDDLIFSYAPMPPPGCSLSIRFLVPCDPMEEQADSHPSNTTDKTVSADIIEAKSPELNAGSTFDARTAQLKIPHDSGLQYVDDACMEILFTSLDYKKIVVLVNGLILDQRILLISETSSKLVMCAEALCSLIAPFRWTSTYIPHLHPDGVDYLDCPGPFIIGASPDIFNSPEGSGIASVSTFFLTNLDTNSVTAPIKATTPGFENLEENAPLPDFPVAVRDRLYERIADELSMCDLTAPRMLNSFSSLDDYQRRSLQRQNTLLYKDSSNPLLPDDDGTHSSESSESDDDLSIHCQDLIEITSRAEIARVKQTLLCVLSPNSLKKLTTNVTVCVCTPFSQSNEATEAHAPYCSETINRLKAAANDDDTSKTKTNASAALHFNKPYEEGMKEMVMSFGPGKLPFSISGWRLLARSSECSAIVSDSVTADDNPVPPLKGYVIVSINKVSTLNLSFRETNMALRVASRPVEIIFARPDCFPAKRPNWIWIDRIRSAFLVAMFELLEFFLKHLDADLRGIVPGKQRYSFTDNFWKGVSWLKEDDDNHFFDSCGFIEKVPSSMKAFATSLVNSQRFASLVDDILDLKKLTTENNAGRLLCRMQGIWNSLPRKAKLQNQQYNDIFWDLVDKMCSRNPWFPFIEMKVELGLDNARDETTEERKASSFLSESSSEKKSQIEFDGRTVSMSRLKNELYHRKISRLNLLKQFREQNRGSLIWKTEKDAIRLNTEPLN